jgi:raffinose/stachyose/melibiose transport system permease protein
MKNKPFRVVTYVFAIFWALITLVPLVTTLLSSFKSNSDIFGGSLLLPTEWLFGNYVDAVVDAGILNSVMNSLILGLGTTLVVLVITMLASYILARQKFFFIKPVYVFFLLGLMLPVHATIIPISKIAASLKATDNFLFIILVYAAFQLPQAIFLVTGFISGISRELDEAAIIDGCSLPGTLLRIITPISAPIISTVAILSFIYGYSELVFSVILLNDKTKFPVSRALMFFTGERVTRMGPVFASIVIAVLPMVILYVFFHEKVQKGMVAGSVKG